MLKPSAVYTESCDKPLHVTKQLFCMLNGNIQGKPFPLDCASFYTLLFCSSFCK